MFKASVCLGRKISRGYNSTNYTVSLEGEVTTPVDQPDAVLKQIDRLFKVAEDAIAKEIDRDQGEMAIGRRDEEPISNGPQQSPPDNRNGSRSNGNGQAAGNGQHADPASQKQLNYIDNLAQRQKLSRQQVDGIILEILGQRVAVNQLTKKEAGRVIERMANGVAANGRN